MADETKHITLTDVQKRLIDDGWVNLARAISDGTVSNLTHAERATLDSAIFGFGVLIDGKRVDPLSLKLLQYGPAPVLSEEEIEETKMTYEKAR